MPGTEGPSSSSHSPCTLRTLRSIGWEGKAVVCRLDIVFYGYGIADIDYWIWLWLDDMFGYVWWILIWYCWQIHDDYRGVDLNDTLYRTWRWIIKMFSFYWGDVDDQPLDFWGTRVTRSFEETQRERLHRDGSQWKLEPWPIRFVDLPSVRKLERSLI